MVYRNSSRHPVRVADIPTSRVAGATAILGSRAHLAASLGSWCGLDICPLLQLQGQRDTSHPLHVRTSQKERLGGRSC